jgi:hypothetical protein
MGLQSYDIPLSGRIELVAYAFYCVDEAVVELFADLPHVYIDGAVYHFHICAPNLIEYFFTTENLSGFGSEE